MARQGYDLQLTRYDEKGWRATFYTSGMEHSPTGRADRDRLGAHAVARDATGGMAEFRVFSPISPLSGLRIHGSGGLP